MSGLPIISPLSSAPISLRDSAAALVPTPPQATAAVVKTITASAVQQARPLDIADAAARKPLPTPHDKRGRLVGPPPTFEVNVLQHLQETRMLPEDPAPGTDADATPSPGNAAIRDAADEPASDEPALAINTAPNTAYQAQGQIDAPAATSQSYSMNISL